MEWLDIVDENGIPTGETVERTRAHAEGIRHRRAHVWLLRRRPEGVEVLLQKRSRTKDSFPGCYDISSAGHIPAGSEVLPSAQRELLEELGLLAEPEDFCYIGIRRFFHETEFYGRPFVDRQVSFVYVLWMDVEPEKMKLQEEEVEEVRWMPLAACIQGVKDGTLHTCLYEEELRMVENAAKEKAGEREDWA